LRIHEVLNYFIFTIVLSKDSHYLCGTKKASI
jgi:hypothetical protein